MSKNTRRLAAVVLAGGVGKRFKSPVPKVLHDCAGLPLVAYAIAAVNGVDGVEKVVVVAGADRPAIESALARTWPELVFVTQPKPRGTADAVRMAQDELTGMGFVVLVVSGDTPLITSETLGMVAESHQLGMGVTLLVAHLEDPTGYGRLVRDDSGDVVDIVEEADASDEQLEINEVSTGIWAFDGDELLSAIEEVTPHNEQGEFYLPDAALVICRRRGRIHTVEADDPAEMMGVNDRVQLSEAAAALRRRKAEELARSGVTIVDLATTYIDRSVQVAPDTVIHPMTFLEGDTTIGSGCSIGPNVRIVDSRIGDRVEVSFAVVRESSIGDEAQVGPFASLRPGTEMATGSKVGTFVETKATRIGEGSKVPHLSYMGDADIGPGSNIGAGTITCNYDGETKTKSKTVIGEDVLIGSDTMLVAPVELGDGAVTGAGSVVTKDVEPEDVVVGAPAKVVRKRKPRPRDNKA